MPHPGLQPEEEIASGQLISNAEFSISNVSSDSKMEISGVRSINFLPF